MSGRRRALVAGGGTAGHVLPALAVARALEAHWGPGSVELVGSTRGMGPALVEGAGVPVTLLPGRGFARRGGARAVAANVAAVAELGAALVAALWIVGRRRPAVVVSLGGYAAVPAGLAAAAWRVPLVVVNVDTVAGAANRVLARLARASAVAYPGTGLPRAVVTGAPVRAEVGAAARPDAARRTAARRALGLPEDGVVVAVFGGSLGARRLNEACLELAARWSGRSDVAIYHVVGRRDASWAAERARRLGLGGGSARYRQVAYEERMARVYEAADVAVCRAGAMTVAELAVVGLPAVLVPLPGAPGDHQGRNAAVLEGAGAAVVLPDADCDGAGLAAALAPLVADPQQRVRMAQAAAAVGRPHAAEAVAVLCQAHARPGRRTARSACATSATVPGSAT